MCTLVLAWQAFDGSPVVVAANRDEALGRPSEPPAVYRTEPRAIAPRDCTAGGTWIGYNAHGLFVGITNRWVDRDGDRSRGQLVADCLGLPSATAARDHVRTATKNDEYAGFNLVVADADRAVLLEWDGNLRVTDLGPGVHVVVNVGADSSFFEPAGRPEMGRRQAENAEAVRRTLGAGTASNADDAQADSADDWLNQAAAVLGDHAFGICVHGDGFGTRSASLIRLDQTDDGVDSRYWFAEGPPCTTPFKPVESRL